MQEGTQGPDSVNKTTILLCLFERSLIHLVHHVTTIYSVVIDQLAEKSVGSWLRAC